MALMECTREAARDACESLPLGWAEPREEYREWRYARALHLDHHQHVGGWVVGEQVDLTMARPPPARQDAIPPTSERAARAGLALPPDPRPQRQARQETEPPEDAA